MRAHREKLIQWIWSRLEFDCDKLMTVCGKQVMIVNQGFLNKREGPDFLNAHILVDGIRWHGDVEIHKEAAEWFAHRHHEDPGFNRVVLHVVLEEPEGMKAITEDGFEPYTVYLKPFLKKPLYLLLKRSRQTPIPCSGLVEGMPGFQDAFRRQIGRASEEYFSYKVNEMLQWYSPEYGLYKAWRRGLTMAIYHTLGVPHNREPMAQLASDLIGSDIPAESDSRHFVDSVFSYAFEGERIYSWKRGGVRPAGRPQKRLAAAAALHRELLLVDPSLYIRSGVALWDELQGRIPSELKLKGQMHGVIYMTVWLPGLWLLGDLVASVKLKRDADEAWREGMMVIPGRVWRTFRKAGFSGVSGKGSPGLVHQYKRYCKEGRCSECEVFKCSIRS